mmetsp:Transcript_12551/g.18325  ORF Transcript_12551/g.18325 Transcript_12551/m.18325 type:complete len:102 (-) Transcript_12551:241-546(-)
MKHKYIYPRGIILVLLEPFVKRNVEHIYGNCYLMCHLIKSWLRRMHPLWDFKKTKYGRFSEPAHVVGVAEEISKCHGISFEEVCEQTTKNALLFFGIKEED